MKKTVKISLVVLALFCIGGLGSLFVNYIVFSKLVTHPVWSDNAIVKALSNKVVVTEHTKEVVVKDNESLSSISAQVSASVVYVENLNSPTENLLGGSGIVISGDGVIAIHESVLEDSDKYNVGFFDGSTYEAKKVFKDDFNGVIFLRVEGRNDLTAMPFANSLDAISGRKLINIYREKMSEQAFFTLGILSGNDYLFQTKQPSCDYLEGVFRVDFNEKALENGLGGPMIDFNGEMVGMLAKNYKDEYFVITSNDVKSAFNRFLEEGEQIQVMDDDSIEGEQKVEERIRLGVSCDSLSQNKNDELNGVRINYSVDDVETKNLAKELGINDQDVITHIDGDEVSLKNPLSEILLNYKKGDVIKVKLLRGGEQVELDINF